MDLCTPKDQIKLSASNPQAGRQVPTDKDQMEGREGVVKLDGSLEVEVGRKPIRNSCLQFVVV